MQIQYELLKTTLKRIFETYTWNSRQIKNSWKISPYKNKEENKNKIVHYICLWYLIQNNLKGHLRIIKYILGLYKLRDV